MNQSTEASRELAEEPIQERPCARGSSTVYRCRSPGYLDRRIERRGQLAEYRYWIMLNYRVDTQWQLQNDGQAETHFWVTPKEGSTRFGGARPRTTFFGRRETVIHIYIGGVLNRPYISLLFYCDNATDA
jgi:hypothetical protein